MSSIKLRDKQRCLDLGEPIKLFHAGYFHVDGGVEPSSNLTSTDNAACSSESDLHLFNMALDASLTHSGKFDTASLHHSLQFTTAGGAAGGGGGGGGNALLNTSAASTNASLAGKTGTNVLNSTKGNANASPMCMLFVSSLLNKINLLKTDVIFSSVNEDNAATAATTTSTTSASRRQPNQLTKFRCENVFSKWDTVAPNLRQHFTACNDSMNALLANNDKLRQILFQAN